MQPATNRMTYSVRTEVFGNPDRGQDPARPPFGVEVVTLTAQTLSGLQTWVGNWQVENNIGAGNWGRPAVLKDGEVVGFMSYNGRVWTNENQEYEEQS